MYIVGSLIVLCLPGDADTVTLLTL